MNGLVALEPPASAVAADVEPAEYARLLGLPRGRRLEGELAERAGEARSWYAAHGRPDVFARRAPVARVGEDRVELETGVLAGRALAERLRGGGAHALLAVAATAGPEVDAEARRLWDEGRPDESYFLDRFGVAVVERLVIHGMTLLCRALEPSGETVLPHLSPGCGGWDLREQEAVMALVTGGDPAAVAPVRMLETGALAPKSSILAVFGVSRARGVPGAADACGTCDLTPCAFRRVPFRGAA